MISKNESLHSVPEKVSRDILKAIHGALEEEKIPLSKRLLKIILSTAVCSIILWAPFALSFKDQIGSIWTIALLVWTMCLAIGFSLYYHPQPRLVLPGHWTPMIFARLLIVSTIATVVEILICPSFVFLESPLSWNPLGPITEILMTSGGMGLCMGFCGFFFSFLSAGLGLGSAWKVVQRSGLEDAPPVIGILVLSQLPVLLVQLLSEDLKPFATYWVLGLIVGTGAAILIAFLLTRLLERQKKMA